MKQNNTVLLAKYRVEKKILILWNPGKSSGDVSDICPASVTQPPLRLAVRANQHGVHVKNSEASLFKSL